MHCYFYQGWHKSTVIRTTGSTSVLLFVPVVNVLLFEPLMEHMEVNVLKKYNNTTSSTAKLEVKLVLMQFCFKQRVQIHVIYF